MPTPMSEYESALFAAVMVLGLAIVDMGANKTLLDAGLRQARDDAAKNGSTDGSAALEMLREAVIEGDTSNRSH